MQLIDDNAQTDINYNNLTRNYLEALDEIGRLSSHLGDVGTALGSKNVEEFRKFLLLWFDIQRKIAWKYVPANYQKTMAEQSGLLSRNLIQSIRNLDFVYSYFTTQYQQNFKIWSDFLSIGMQNMAGTFDIYAKIQSDESGFLYEQDRQFVETIRNTDKAYENYEHSQNLKKTKSKSIQSDSKTLDDTSSLSRIQ